MGRVGRAMMGAVLVIAIGCQKGQDEVADPVAAMDGLDWDSDAPAVPCNTDLGAPLAKQVLADAELDASALDLGRDSMGDSYLSRYLDPDLPLFWFEDLRSDPTTAPCFAHQVAADLDHAMAAPHPVASAIGVAIDRLEVHDLSLPLDPDTAEQDLVDLSPLPEDLAQALVPILAALASVKEVRRDVAAGAPDATQILVTDGHMGLLYDSEPNRRVPDFLVDPSVKPWLRNAQQGPTALYGPARVLAHAIEHADLQRFVGLDVSFDEVTDVGRIVIAGPRADEPGDIGPVALYLDLGGDDVYVHPAGANGEGVPAGVHIDLGGHDTYGYVGTDAGSDWLLSSDAEGREVLPGFVPGRSLSTEGRHGAGRFGVGLLIDLGEGDDRYESLRMSQGWAHLGVGVLYDDGGDDTYLAEEGVQGAGTVGIGLLLDAGDGSDVRRAFRCAQGFAFTSAMGVAWDGGGDDVWLAIPGDGTSEALYPNGFLENTNQSRAQGAALGFYYPDLVPIGGGIGVLRDVSGDDSYEIGVSGQGNAMFHATGLLLDGDGADSYDARWDAQGRGEDLGVGVLLDHGAHTDTFNERVPDGELRMGSADYHSLGLLVIEDGNDIFHIGPRSAGATDCTGLGWLVDNDGDDTYIASSDQSTGYGGGSECAVEGGLGIGLFVDAGGTDHWVWPDDSDRLPADDSAFGAPPGHSTAHGGAVDGSGESGIHAGPNP